MRILPFAAAITAFAFIPANDASAASKCGLGEQGMGSPGTIETERTWKTPGPFPTGLAWDGRLLWLADRRTDTLYAIDPLTGKTARRLPAPGWAPTGLAWDGRALWVSDAGELRIFQVDVEKGLVLKSVEFPSQGVDALAWDGANLWTADAGKDEISKIAISDGTSLVTFKAPASDPAGMTFDGKYLWVTDRVRDEIYMVSPENGNVILYFSSPGKYAAGLAWDGRLLWNADYQDKALHAIRLPAEKFLLKNERHAEVLFTQEFRNFGPDEVTGLDFFLAIPVSRDNQKIEGGITYEPAPLEFAADEEGQKVAHYRFETVKPGKPAAVNMRVKVRTHEINYLVFPDRLGGLDEVPQEMKARYLSDNEKFDMKNPAIQSAVAAALGDEKNPYWIARKIYNYILDHMSYELLGGWNAAPTVLARGTGSCSEYSFVTIAMCRAAGLPARYVGSVVVRKDDASMDDVFHRWVEVYLPRYGWLPIDPSGGDQPLPADQAAFFGHLSNRFLITTESSGGSPLLGWTYNSNVFFNCKGRCKTAVESFGEWTPLAEETK